MTIFWAHLSICITFCLSVTWPKFRLDHNSDLTKSHQTKINWLDKRLKVIDLKGHQTWSGHGRGWLQPRSSIILQSYMWLVHGYASSSKVSWVKVKGCVGQLARDIRHSWAHVNVKLHFSSCFHLSEFLSTQTVMQKKKSMNVKNDMQFTKSFSQRRIETCFSRMIVFSRVLYPLSHLVPGYFSCPLFTSSWHREHYCLE